MVNINIEFTPDQLQYIANVLSAQPYKDVSILLASIQDQYTKATTKMASEH